MSEPQQTAGTAEPAKAAVIPNTEGNQLPTLDKPEDDPRIYLEDQEAALPWVTLQNARTMARFGGTNLEADIKTLTKLYSRPDKIPMFEDFSTPSEIERIGNYIYEHWADDRNPKGIWRRMTFENWQTGNSAWETVLDLDAYGKTTGTDWVWKGSQIETQKCLRAMISLSAKGNDLSELFEFDLVSKQFVEDGFKAPAAKQRCFWAGPDTLLIISSYGEGMKTSAGAANAVRNWKRGELLSNATVIFKSTGDNSASFYSYHIDGKTLVTFAEFTGFNQKIIWIGDEHGPNVKLDFPQDTLFHLYPGWMVLHTRVPYEPAGKKYAADSLLGISLKAYLNGSRDFSVLLEPGTKRVITNCFWTDGKFVIHYLDNLYNRLIYYIPGSKEWTRRALPLPDLDSLPELRPVDNLFHRTNGDVFVRIDNPITPTRLYVYNVNDPPSCDQLVPVRESKAVFNSTGLTFDRYETDVPGRTVVVYKMAGPQQPDPNAPVYIDEYSGFEEIQETRYSAGLGKFWLERGASIVFPYSRGSGALGVGHRDAGRGRHKSNRDDDCATVAMDLRRRGYKRVVCYGGSDGGLMAGNELTRYPECFDGLVSEIPLADMYRHDKLQRGSTNATEYGADWKTRKSISWYHRIEPGRNYPPILIVTRTDDDRVDPAHARKAACKLLDLGHTGTYFHEGVGGHDMLDPVQRAENFALQWAFLWQAAQGTLQQGTLQ
jgi:prolyl oligopeptidase